MADQPTLALAALNLGAGEHRVTVKVVDPTEFVRDPVMRDTSFSATRTWVVGASAPLAAGSVAAAFTSSTQTTRPVAGTEVVYVETAHPADRVLGVVWRLDGRVVANAANSRTFNLGKQKLSPGTHRVSAAVTDPGNPRAAAQTLNWIVDNTGPKVAVTLSQAAATAARPDGAQHHVMRDQFTMKLDASDDQPGYVVAEFRVNGDGWHHYYGWPDAVPGTPYLFTARGTTIKELVYGSLSAEGLSPQPWEPREPGWGTHRIEYRARDAAGNIGTPSQFFVTVLPAPKCTSTITDERRSGDLVVQSGVTCVIRTAISGRVTVSPGASLVATNATLRGGLTATNAAIIELTGSEIDGAVRIDGTTGHLALVGNRIQQNLSCTGNAKLYVGPNTVRAASGQCGGNR
jgi:hypothetical protein